MVSITREEEGRRVGSGVMSADEIKQLFGFCRNFDIVEGQPDPDKPSYLFDVRSEVIHWLDRQNRGIQSSMYFNRSKGTLSIETDKNIPAKVALQKWIDVINDALRDGI